MTDLDTTALRRFRFHVPGDDPRPMAFPPVAPFWCTGYGDEFCVVVAYAPSLDVLTDEGHWPDAEQIDDQGPSEIVFSSRFPKPHWWSRHMPENDTTVLRKGGEHE